MCHMKKLRRMVRGAKQLVFLDLEGTQFSHEMIAIGAVKVTLKPDGSFKKVFPGFKRYVLAHNNIGRIVENLTGITGDLLAREGIDFGEAILLLKKYVGNNFAKSRFVTFGTHDMRILRQSQTYNPEAPHIHITTIMKNHLDLSSLINEYIKDEKNNTLSLVNLCKLFNIEQVEPAHDPLNDALMLAYIYRELLTQTELLKERYAQVLLNMNNLPRPIKKLLTQIKNGESVNYDDLYHYLQDEIA